MKWVWASLYYLCFLTNKILRSLFLKYLNSYLTKVIPQFLIQTKVNSNRVAVGSNPIEDLVLGKMMGWWIRRRANIQHTKDDLPSFIPPPLGKPYVLHVCSWLMMITVIRLPWCLWCALVLLNRPSHRSLPVLIYSGLQVCYMFD
jgi:hypothetical protein